MNNLQYTSQNISWCSPLDLAANISDNYWILLHSGTKTNYTGRYSLLACGLNEKITANDFAEFDKNLSSDKPCFENAWFGYLGYDLKNTLENLETDKADWLDMPDLNMLKFNNIYQFDHETQTLTLWSNGQSPIQTLNKKIKATNIPSVINISSNMTRDEYLKKAEHVIECIHAGDLYQANLTRKFYGEFTQQPDYFQLFKKLCSASPAPYSVFMRMDDIYILSSSPECLLNVDIDGNITTRPIKGTSPRGADKKSDDDLRQKLSESEKDRAENLMIVDLMRNDLAKCCVAGSVKTESLFDITTHATIHHLSSTISGKKRSDYSTLDAVKATFPAGSMTGAPKISAINLCSKLERKKRGVYSGAIGWFGGDGSCDLSVVIRTLIIKDKKFEFQVGGGIVADSTPEKELDELINKAKGILLALDVLLDTLRNI
jgi:para-aminobenzoate synthetase component 1